MLKIIKRPELAKGQAIKQNILTFLSIAVGLVLLIALLGLNPFEIFIKMIEGSLMSAYRLKETINKAIPLVVLSLGIAVAFKMKFWNIGAEGQLYMGGYAASIFALNMLDAPNYVLLPIMALSAFVMGAIWLLIPAILKLKFGTNETLVTLMLNFVAVKWISYLQYGPWKDPKASGFPIIPRFTKNAILPDFLGVHLGWVVAVVLVIALFYLLNKSKLGYEIAVLGENDNTARYAGINVTKTVILAAIISGGLCGLAGMIQASAIEKSLSEQMSGGIGFTAVITAWLSKLNPAMVVIVSLLFAVLVQGGAYLQGALQVPSSVSDIIQGAILLFVLGSEFFQRYQIVSVLKLKKLSEGK